MYLMPVRNLLEGSIHDGNKKELIALIKDSHCVSHYLVWYHANNNNRNKMWLGINQIGKHVVSKVSFGSAFR